MKLRKFQRDFIRKATAPGVNVAALSMPRGNGKSSLAGHLAARIMDPDDDLFRPGTESVCVASSLEQGRIVYRFARDLLADNPDYRFADSLTKVQITHKPTKTALQVRSSNARGVFGLVNCPWVILDEPGAFEAAGGELLWDAVETSTGKPGSPLKVLLIGTIAPAAAGGWWPELVDAGTNGSTYVQALQGDRETWDQWPTIRKANPLTAISAEFRAKILEERDKARKDSRLKARFLSYRLNIPTADESEMLLTVDDFDLVKTRPVGIPTGRPIVGVDLGGGRSWSAAVAVWQSGRVEAMAVAPGIPDLSDQEKRDHVPSGLYVDLHRRGLLAIAEGLRVQPPAQLWESIRARWGTPVRVVCDRFRLAELEDAIQGACRVEARVTRWSDAAADIRALRRISRDGPASIPESDQLLIAASLSQATVKSDDQGNTRLVKRTRHNTARDDVAAALLLAAGAFDRAGTVAPARLTYAAI